MVDLCGAFLKGNFKKHEEKVFMEVPQGFKHIYKQVRKECQEGHISKEEMAGRALELHEEWMQRPEDHWKIIKEHQKPQGSVAAGILELLHTIYRTVQAAMAFFQELLKAFKFSKYNRSKADPCLHYK